MENENNYLGVSQGACISLLVGLTFEHLIGGVISLSGYLFPEIKIREENNENFCRTRRKR